MNRLLITPDHLRAIDRHGEQTYPEECCGFLIGQASGDRTVVERLLPVANERQDSRHNRYVINPETVLAAHKEARAAGADVVGYYHSHPDHPSKPSDFDREHAWPGLSYLIVSVRKGRAADARSWRLADDRDQFDEEIIDPAADPAGFPGLEKEAV
ncbi:MAG: M67 family metallopeptidase [Thermoanaerobaculia bacterium]